SQQRSQEAITNIEEKIVSLQNELAETEHQVTALEMTESTEFSTAKGKYDREAEHLQHIVNQQQLRLAQTSEEIATTEKDTHNLDITFKTVLQLEAIAASGGKQQVVSKETIMAEDQFQSLMRADIRRQQEEEEWASAQRTGEL
ncbi:unnamed protein product, partial [Choristocarpus tenellus]